MMKELDITIQSAASGSPMDADNEAVARVREAANGYRAVDHGGDRLRVHLVLRNQALADSLKRTPLPDELAENIELYAYTAEDLWAMEMLGVRPDSDTRLDRQPLTTDSPQFIHLVIFGSGGQAESLAIHTALTAHFPNYCVDHALRTRITMVSDTPDDLRHFQQRYRNLLAQSHRRTVHVDDDDVRCEELTPQYAGHRDDFVDIEWEFVTAHSDNGILNYKLQKWARDESRQFTVAFCYADDSRNVSETLTLPSAVLSSTPVWLRVCDARAVDFLKQSEQFAHVIPFGMRDTKLPDMSRFIRMAQCVHFAYSHMRETTLKEQSQGRTAMEVAVEIPTERQLQELWNSSRLTTPKRWSNVYHAFTLRSKMHSLDHPAEEWGTLFAISDHEVESLSEVEHNRWSVEELILGYRPTTEAEHADILKDPSLRTRLKSEYIHEDLRSYRELGVDETGLPVTRYDMGLIRTLPLVAYTYHQLNEKRHE